MQVDYSNLPEYLRRVQAEMRPLQVRCVSHCKKNPRTIIDSWMGTGKTLMGLTATFIQQPERVLIACSKNALWTWKHEIEKWYPEYAKPGMYTVISGSPIERRKLWSKNTLFYVCTYNVLRNDMAIAKDIPFDVFILDEFHRSGLRQHTMYKKRKTDAKTGAPIKTLTGYGALKQLQKIPCIFAISGTVLSRGPQDVWPTLNILDSRLFASYWKFINTFCIVLNGAFGMDIAGAQNTAGLRQISKPYWYRISKEEAMKEMPPLTKQIVPIEMSDTQKRMYAKIEKDMYIELASGELNVASTSLGASTKLRQLLTCPKIIDPDVDDYGAGIETVVDMAKDAENHHIVVFTPYRAGVTYIKEYLKKHLTEDVFHIWGGLEPEELHARIKAWKQSKGAMVCTVLFSQSFELETSSACYFVGYEWDQNDNNQASSRLQRLISPGPIMAYYMQYKGTIDEHILEVLNNKTRTVKVTVQDFKDSVQPKLEAKYGGAQLSLLPTSHP